MTVDADMKALAIASRSALRHLNQVMDQMSFCLGDDPERLILWGSADVLRGRILAGGFPDPWPVPMNGTERCMRLTHKGDQCQVFRRDGHVACHLHEQPYDYRIRRAWQDAVHYPFQREAYLWPLKNTDAELQRIMSPWFTWTPPPDADTWNEDDVIVTLRSMVQELS